MTEETLTRARRIKLLLLDVDGVLTDCKLYFDNAGNELKAFNTLDGQGLKLLQKSGVKVGIITGRTSALVARRARDLGITLLIQGREDKWQALGEMIEGMDIELDEIAHMGDDWPDLTIMTRVGLALSVPNGHSAVTERAHWISHNRGGDGAVRDACDLIMQAQGSYTAMLAPFIATED
ncbi:KdsC family phosphatase [Gilvimarinus japonicus]|jgi:3-deoxy-D-manno-octulosonate 8-phosphate phosphatase (KDO 8-P phosphatase)|uniref:3-deoxy-D-manno-octulosonate 8-phosphate phosphatase KdsC n=1 Tax=Gilvimarinus japonicus TaxID=1796469 RepID=A0ABV7HMD3_9GAMM